MFFGWFTKNQDRGETIDHKTYAPVSCGIECVIMQVIYSYTFEKRHSIARGTCFYVTLRRTRKLDVWLKDDILSHSAHKLSCELLLSLYALHLLFFVWSHSPMLDNESLSCSLSHFLSIVLSGKHLQQSFVYTQRHRRLVLMKKWNDITQWMQCSGQRREHRGRRRQWTMRKRSKKEMRRLMVFVMFTIPFLFSRTEQYNAIILIAHWYASAGIRNCWLMGNESDKNIVNMHNMCDGNEPLWLNSLNSMACFVPLYSGFCLDLWPNKKAIFLYAHLHSLLLFINTVNIDLNVNVKYEYGTVMCAAVFSFWSQQMSLLAKKRLIPSFINTLPSISIEMKNTLVTANDTFDTYIATAVIILNFNVYI